MNKILKTLAYIFIGLILVIGLYAGTSFTTNTPMDLREVVKQVETIEKSPLLSDTILKTTTYKDGLVETHQVCKQVCYTEDRPILTPIKEPILEEPIIKG